MFEYYGKYDKNGIVKLFVDNLIWGNITINSFASQMERADEFTRSLEHNIIDFQKNPTEDRIDWIYEAIIKLRVHGALSYELRDMSAEETINGLRETIRQKDNEIDTLHSDNIKLASELRKIKTTEPPMKSGFDALR
jgi:hypothetical protein